MKCYVCGRGILGVTAQVFLEDDGNRSVPVGPDCHRKAVRAGTAGIQSRGGPRVFADREQAQAYSKRRYP